MPKLRLDNALVEKGLAPSRNKAQAIIMAGEVLVNNQVETRADRNIKEEDIISLKEKSCPYVSRGGLKLKGALNNFNISIKDKICVDIGVATGGFSHCMLMEGAKKVYGVDVGKGQIASEIFCHFFQFRQPQDMLKPPPGRHKRRERRVKNEERRVKNRE